MRKKQYSHIGRELRRCDGIPKVTGRAVFIDDIKFPGMLYAKVVRSTIAHGYILAVDDTASLSTAGVVKVVTGEECAVRYGACLADRYPLAKGKVRFIGEPVAVVLAASPEAASLGAARVRVSYQKLPHMLDPREAARDCANLIHEQYDTYARIAGICPESRSNIFHHFKIRRGDVEQAFKRAHLVVENEYIFPLCSHGQLEPHGAVAVYENGTLTMWASSQAPFIVRKEAAHLLGLSPAAVRIIAPYVGGGFGGKSDVTIEPLLAYTASKMPGRHIKLVLSREEMFDGTVVGRGTYALYKTAFSKEGRVLAQKTEAYLSGGGYGDCAVNIVSGMGMAVTGPYQVENISTDVYGVYTNTPPTGAYRGYGHPEAHFGAERQIDIAAGMMGFDPVEIRLLNGLVPGRKNAIGQVMTEHNGRLDECIRAVAREIAWDKPFDHTGGRITRGRGIAAFMKAPVMPTNAQSGVIMKLNEDGTVSLSVGAVEIGQGSCTALTQIAAEALGLPPDKIVITQEVDTRYSPYEWQTVASRTTWASGNAILLAAARLKEKILQSASLFLELPAEALNFSGEKVEARGGAASVLLRDLGVGCRICSGEALTAPLMAEASFVPSGLTCLDRDTGQGNAAADWTFGCTGVELEVDRASGDIRVIRIINAIDAGTIINPRLAAGQAGGAALQALGGVFSEVLVFSAEGDIRNKTLVDYKMPELADVPPITSLFIETPEETGPFGARGLGEHGTVGVAPAAVNALKDALGIDFFSLPITPGRIIEALKKGANP